MNDRVSIVIIGGGALGLAAAYNLLGKGRQDIVLLEKNDAFGMEQSGSNSGVIHAGFLYPTGTLMAGLCVEGAELLFEFCRRHGVPYQKTGKLMVAVDKEQEKTLEAYFRLAADNGLQGIELLSGREAQKLEPCVEAHAALHVPQSGVFDPSFYVAALYQKTAALHDTPDMLMRGCKVTGVEAGPDGFTLAVEQLRGETKRWQLDCDMLINAAGLYSPDIAAMIDPRLPFEKQYLRGEYYQFNRRADLFIRMNVYPTPIPIKLPGGGEFIDLGAHLTPKVGPDERGRTQVAKEILVGPIFTEISDPEDYRSSMDAAAFYEPVKPFFPSLRKEDLYRGHAGILGMIKNQSDFIIHRDEKIPNCIHLLGMESPALTASLAIGKYVATLICD
jgi:L-2-hydroxyglutarate oxidase LhgO